MRSRRMIASERRLHEFVQVVALVFVLSYFELQFLARRWWMEKVKHGSLDSEHIVS